MATLQVNGAELFYERTGEGEPVVFTHGAWSDGRTWQAVSERMASRFEVVIWDRRGHSRSQRRDGPGNFQEDAADLAMLIERLGDRVHAVGTSAGGGVVLNLLTTRPDLVKTASVHEPGPFGLLEEGAGLHLMQLIAREKALATEVERMIAGGDARRAAEYFIDNIAVGAGGWEQFPDEFKAILTANASTVADDFRDSFDPGSVDIAGLAASSIPLLISTGSEGSELERAAVRELVRRVPAANLVELAGAGHLPHRTHPDDYAAMLMSFIDQAFVAGSVL